MYSIIPFGGVHSDDLSSAFDLVVAREGREASLDALSEGELELLGFVAALAGHEPFDGHEIDPADSAVVSR